MKKEIKTVKDKTYKTPEKTIHVCINVNIEELPN